MTSNETASELTRVEERANRRLEHNRDFHLRYYT